MCERTDSLLKLVLLLGCLLLCPVRGSARNPGPSASQRSTMTEPASESDIALLKTFTSVGKQVDVLDGYEEAELLAHEGRGCLTHMWFGGNWKGYEKTRIRICVDGERTPSIDMELGLGHGFGFAADAAPWGSEKVGKTGSGSGEELNGQKLHDPPETEYTTYCWIYQW